MNTDTRQPGTSHPHPAPQRHDVNRWWMWVCLALPPAVWFLQLTLANVLTSQACFPADMPLQQPRMNVVPWVVGCDLVVLVAALAGGFVGWRNWQRTAGEKPGGGHHLLESGDGRTRFMAMSGMLTSGIVLVASIYALLSHLTVPWCGT